ncbi:hypothetical protein [cf. Phormidesmis sp. LEGE 11477]|uniref:hypothetical protein n=1 Tax=cf. Phormidesmis sp. LEGE 11477 TaxID=1828680 RepID=UPI001880DB00|nr:hypothetical protein [cf. Phormidesmis sp. LEGE 11477]MBE9061869.1 hypothetical protein [cf. Phormidesmis sp. LEGE 11477]
MTNAIVKAAMISLLQTWKHLEPQGLWPALGGLAVLTHVGILGFSLPYLIEMMQPPSGSQTAAVPVELIVEPGALSTALTPDSQPSTNRVTEPVAASADSPDRINESPTQTATPATPTSPASPASSSVSSASIPLESSSPESPPPQKADPVQPPPLTAGSEDSAESNTDLPAPASETSTDASTSTNSSPVTQNSASPSSVPQKEETLPTLSGDSDIPVPGSEPAGDETPQTAYLKVVSHAHIPRSLLIDIAPNPPVPIYDAITAVELRPQEVNCERVDFSVSQVTYRIAVNKDGSMRHASPWSGSIEESAPLTAEESAIACLLLASGFRFTPATFEGEPVVSDNLLLTIDVVESQLN